MAAAGDNTSRNRTSVCWKEVAILYLVCLPDVGDPETPWLVRSTLSQVVQCAEKSTVVDMTDDDDDDNDLETRGQARTPFLAMMSYFVGGHYG